MDKNMTIYLRKPIKISATPAPIKSNFPTESLSAIPTSPIAIVEIKTTGPTTASNALIATAFSTLLNRNISAAADNSINPEMTRITTIPNTAASNPENIDFIFSTLYNVLFVQPMLSALD